MAKVMVASRGKHEGERVIISSGRARRNVLESASLKSPSHLGHLAKNVESLRFLISAYVLM
jgi:hypothetical protein